MFCSVNCFHAESCDIHLFCKLAFAFSFFFFFYITMFTFIFLVNFTIQTLAKPPWLSNVCRSFEEADTEKACLYISYLSCSCTASHNITANKLSSFPGIFFFFFFLNQTEIWSTKNIWKIKSVWVRFKKKKKKTSCWNSKINMLMYKQVK